MLVSRAQWRTGLLDGLGCWELGCCAVWGAGNWVGVLSGVLWAGLEYRASESTHATDELARMPIVLRKWIVEMPYSPKFFSVNEVEGIPEIILGTADFVSHPIIALAAEEFKAYVNKNKPKRLVLNFKNVSHISSEFITALIPMQEAVTGNDGQMKLSHMNETVLSPFKLTKLAGRLFMIYETTPQAIDAF